MLLTDGEIRHVFFNEQTNIALVDSLVNERNCTQLLPQLETVCPIGQIMHKASILGLEIDFSVNANFFDQTKESSIKQLF